MVGAPTVEPGDREQIEGLDGHHQEQHLHVASLESANGKRQLSQVGGGFCGPRAFYCIRE